jgi:hypothetical protein
VRVLAAKSPMFCASSESTLGRRSPDTANPVEPLGPTGFEPIADYLVIAMRCAAVPA